MYALRLHLLPVALTHLSLETAPNHPGSAASDCPRLQTVLLGAMLAYSVRPARSAVTGPDSLLVHRVVLHTIKRIERGRTSSSGLAVRIKPLG